MKRLTMALAVLAITPAAASASFQECGITTHCYAASDVKGQHWAYAADLQVGMHEGIEAQTDPTPTGRFATWEHWVEPTLFTNNEWIEQGVAWYGPVGAQKLHSFYAILNAHEEWFVHADADAGSSTVMIRDPNFSGCYELLEGFYEQPGHQTGWEHLRATYCGLSPLMANSETGTEIKNQAQPTVTGRAMVWVDEEPGPPAAGVPYGESYPFTIGPTWMIRPWPNAWETEGNVEYATPQTASTSTFTELAPTSRIVDPGTARMSLKGPGKYKRPQIGPPGAAKPTAQPYKATLKEKDGAYDEYVGPRPITEAELRKAGGT
jgi:hypothetical protein